MCKRNENEVLIIGNSRRARSHDNLIEVKFSGDKMYVVFYQDFFEKHGNIIGKNDYVRFFADKEGQYIRVEAQPVKGTGCYKLCKRPQCHPDSRQVAVPRFNLWMFAPMQGRKTPTVSEHERSIMLNF